MYEVPKWQIEFPAMSSFGNQTETFETTKEIFELNYFLLKREGKFNGFSTIIILSEKNVFIQKMLRQQFGMTQLIFGS